MKLSERIRDWAKSRFDKPPETYAEAEELIEQSLNIFAIEVEELEAEIENLKKDQEPFRAQIDQRKTYKTHDD